MVQDWPQLAVVVAGLEDRGVWADLVLTDQLLELQDRLHGAERGAINILGQCDLLDSFHILNRLRLVHFEDHSAHIAKADQLDVAPTKKSDRVNVLVRLRDQRR